MTRPILGPLAFTGINMDTLPGDLATDWWSGGRNVFFRAGNTARIPGEDLFAEAGRLNAADVIWYFDAGAQQWWIYASARSGSDIGVAVTDGTSHYDVTPVGWASIASKNFILTIGDLNGLPFINHPEIGPFWWGGNPAAKMAKLPGWPAGNTCRVMRAHKNFLMAICMDLSVGGLQEGVCQWSVSADPGQVPSTWVPSPTNDAGEFTFAQPGGQLIDGISVRDQFFMAKANAIYAGQYVGGQFVFGSRDLFPSIGLLAAGAWCESGNVLYFLSGQSEFMRTDGASSPENLLYGVLQEYLRAQINAEYPSSIFCVRDDPHGQVLLCYPVGSSVACTEAIQYEVTSGRPSIRDLAGVYSASQGLTNIAIETWDSDSRTWNSDSSTWNEQASGYTPTHLVFGAGDIGMVEQGKGNQMVQPDGTLAPFTSYVERKGIDMDELDYRKVVTGVMPRLKGTPGGEVMIQWGAQDSGEAPMDLTDPMPFGIGERWIDFRLDGRMHYYKIFTDDGPPWELSTTRVFAKKTGRW